MPQIVLSVPACVLASVVATKRVSASSARVRDHAWSEVILNVTARVLTAVVVCECLAASSARVRDHAWSEVILNVTARVLTAVVVCECLAASSARVRDHAWSEVTFRISASVSLPIISTEVVCSTIRWHHSRAHVITSMWTARRLVKCRVFEGWRSSVQPVLRVKRAAAGLQPALSLLQLLLIPLLTQTHRPSRLRRGCGH